MVNLYWTERSVSAYRRDPQPGSCTSCCHGDLRLRNEDKGTPVDIKEEDIVSSIHEALQFVSYYHPRDLIQHLSAALRHWSPFDEEITPTRSQNFALNISKI